MSDQSYTTTIVVDKTPAEVFNAINNVRGWWSGEFVGSADKLGAEFNYRYKDLHDTTQKVTEFVPGKKIVWHVVKGTLNFLKKDMTEWVGTDIVFEISEKDGKTEVHFTHFGIVPECECYGACSNGWSMLVNRNLRNFIETGEIQPDPFA
jgi:hypothetical protein